MFVGTNDLWDAKRHLHIKRRDGMRGEAPLYGLGGKKWEVEVVFVACWNEKPE